ncbi:hypothetical protein NFI96_001896 [Prochilodus magdalenae]|nr:hypothetical protein NFI96_001896 [Prochilodus magdalenae]
MGPKRTRVERREEEAAGGEMDEVPGDEVELGRIAEDSSLQELRDMLRTHLAMQQARDSRMEQESIRQEARLKALQHQFNLLQQEVHRRTTPAPGQVVGDSIQHDTVTVRQTPLLPMDGQSSIQPTVQARLWSSQGRDQTGVEREPLNDAEDIEHYLTTFERIAVACRWPTTDWAVRLVPLLTGKARSAYVHMDIKDSLDYAKVKAAILSKYNINPESYRLQFRATEIGEEETPKELYVRLKELFQKWVQPQNRTKEEIAEVIILEQYLRMLAPELQIWIKEHNPCSASEAAMLADIFVAARRKAQPWTYRRWKETKEPTKPRKMLPSVVALVEDGKSGGDRVAKQCPSLRPRTLICYRCGQEGIKGIRTTPYHPQTDGLVERFNQTLKQMLRKFVNETGTDWDQWLPYLLFAYREVPQASTGFSPFELLYCREVRGPLSLLKDTWVGGQESVETKNIVAYVLQMREKLENMTKLAHENMEEAQRRQKTWYDHKARARSFNPGDKVLVMLPSEASKLLAKWQGPFEVVQKLEPTTYEVASPGERRSRRVLHINLLKEWHERTKSEVLMIRHVEDEEEVNEQYLPDPSHTNLDISHLSANQQSDIQGLCCSKVLQERPGRTLLVERDIVLSEGAAARRMSYRIPERLLTALREEIDQMLAMGIIESSKSEWCSPVVLVPKKDGSLRVCVDFRYLNSVSKFDSYPTPRIDSLIECLGKAKWLTTIDLRKGYWQVPLSARSKELTAFWTPWGLFHFSVMPFGLHGAPATFQRLMDQVLTGLNTFAAAYLDDIIVYSSSWEDHVRHLGQVFERIRSAGLTINPSKCAIAKTETEYLGYVIGNGIIKPRFKTQVRSFLGMAGWYRRFVPNFSIRAVALIDLTRKNSPNKIQWTEEAEAAFKDIKDALCADPVLYCPDFAKPFVLQTDASETGIGAVLLQGEPEDRHPVAYISRKLFPREVRYSTVEKECLAVKWALDTFSVCGAGVSGTDTAVLLDTSVSLLNGDSSDNQKYPASGVLWAASCGQRPVGSVLWAASCGQCPVGSVLWAASCGQCPVNTHKGLEGGLHELFTS